MGRVGEICFNKSRGTRATTEPRKELDWEWKVDPGAATCAPLPPGYITICAIVSTKCNRLYLGKTYRSVDPRFVEQVPQGEAIHGTMVRNDIHHFVIVPLAKMLVTQEMMLTLKECARENSFE